MRKMLVFLILYSVAALVLGLLLANATDRINECHKLGGTIVRTAIWFECAQLEVIEQ